MQHAMIQFEEVTQKERTPSTGVQLTTNASPYYNEERKLMTEIRENGKGRMGITMALEQQVKQLKVYDDSALVIYQLHGEWEMRDAKLILYHNHITLIKSPSIMSCETKTKWPMP
ncbi:hypothetical protein CR513_57175, partial [Mucuna pruriens]